jgi:hypothetical protein
MTSFETLADWRREADHLAAFTVLSERELDVGRSDEQTGGIHGRRVTLRVDDVTWSRPGAPPLPRRLTMVTAGWDVHDGRHEPLDLGGTRLEVGRRYVAPLRFFGRGRAGGWGPLGQSTQLELDGDTVIARQQTVDELAADLRAGRP